MEKNIIWFTRVKTMIVIDPSKGGRESGVTGNGIVEKDYNLLISE